MKKDRLFKIILLPFMFLFTLFLPRLSVDFLPENASFIAYAQETTIPVETAPNLRWNHDLMNIEQAWADGYTGAGITISILDTGFYHRHPDIEMAGGYSVFPDDAWSNDHSGHGTHIAGIIGANADSSYPGIAPNANIYGIKIYHSADMDERGYVSTDVNSVIKGIRQAINIESDIIVISSGLTFDDPDLHAIIREAYNAGIVMIAASGNGNATVNYPASYDEVLSVTAIDERMHPALDIIYGKENDFAAPGVNIGGLSIPESAYSYPYIFMSGSSQATPHVAGLAAIIMEKHGVRGQEAVDLMRSYAMDIGDENLYGNGLLHYVSQTETTEVVEVVNPEVADTPEEVEEVEPSAEDTEEEAEARKPDSSRAADADDPDTMVATQLYQTDLLEQDGRQVLGYDVLPIVESGATLEIILGDYNSVFLSEEQIQEIRIRNIRLALTKENVTWYIPPANFLSGEATLRFYEGLPLGAKAQAGAVTPIYTISIYQRKARQDSHPGWMELKFRTEDLPETNYRQLKGYRWAQWDKEWSETATEIHSDHIMLRTRHASSLGLFNPDHVGEMKTPEAPIEVENDPSNRSDNMTVSTNAVLIVAVILVSATLLTLLIRVAKHKHEN